MAGTNSETPYRLETAPRPAAVSRAEGFTLIELLVVVAIISILAAIAIPNFLEAQVRAKVASAQADMRTIATALEAYYIDHSEYPATVEPVDDWFAYVRRLTTPVSYMTTLPYDPFDPREPAEKWKWFEYWSEPTCGFDIFEVRTGALAAQWLLWSWGPDQDPDDWTISIHTLYDSSNGTMSHGNLYRTGP